MNTLEGLWAHLHKATKAEPARRERVVVDMELPGDAFNNTFTEGDVLEWMDWTYSRSDSSGEHWTRPGKGASEGTSATIFIDADGETHCTIWSSTVTSEFPTLEVNVPQSAFSLFTHFYFRGDFRKAARSLYEAGFGELPEHADDGLLEEIAASIEAENLVEEPEEDEARSSWRRVDWKRILTGDPAPGPELLARADGQFMLYRGKVHGFYGEPESMKSWGAHVAVVETINAGEDVIMIDFENSAYDVGPRLVALGLTAEELEEHLAFIHPSGNFDPDAQAALNAELADTKFALAVVDGVTDAMALMGLDPEKNKDASVFDHTLLRPLARHGAAVVVIDHVAKNTESRGRWAIGAQHKQAAITGAALTFEVVRPFGHGMEGLARVVIKKDKPGHLRKLARGDRLFELWLKSHDDGAVSYQVREPVDFDEAALERPNEWMVAISGQIERKPGLRKENYLTLVNGLDKPKAKLAFDMLEREGWIKKDVGKGAGGYRSDTPYTVYDAELNIDDPRLSAAARTETDEFGRRTSGQVDQKVRELVPAPGTEPPEPAVAETAVAEGSSFSEKSGEANLLDDTTEFFSDLADLV